MHGNAPQSELPPYCGTGHKTTFGLGQTRLGWSSQPNSIETLLVQTLLAKRIEQLTEMLMLFQKRRGGDRTQSKDENPSPPSP